MPGADPLGPAPLDVKTDPDTLPVLPTLTPPTGPEKYEAAVGRAFLLMADKKDAEALAALQEAQSAQATDFVKTEIARLQARITKAEAAQKAADAIKVVLEAGQADQASKLATDALGQFGDTDLADTFTTLKRQADALLVVQAGATGKQKLLDDAEAARKADNPRCRPGGLRAGGRRRGRPRPAQGHLRGPAHQAGRLRRQPGQGRRAAQGPVPARTGGHRPEGRRRELGHPAGEARDRRVRGRHPEPPGPGGHRRLRGDRGHRRPAGRARHRRGIGGRMRRGSTWSSGPRPGPCSTR